MTVFELSDHSIDAQQHPVGLISHDLSAIKQKGKYAFLRAELQELDRIEG